MRRKACFLLSFLLICGSLMSQTHTAVPLENPVYYVLELALMRGLCESLPEAKPYSQAVVLKCIDQILSYDGPRPLKGTERRILEEYRVAFSPGKKGLDLGNANYYFVYTKDDFRFTSEFDFNVDLLFSEGFYNDGKGSVWSTDFWPSITARGDIGYNFSYSISLLGGIMRAPRAELGTYNTYYQGFNNHGQDEFENRVMTTYSEPLSFFPYTYRKRWDGFVWNYKDASNSGQLPWPEGISVGYGMLGELSGTGFSERLTYRFGRLDREWAGMSNGSSLTLNQAARPFMALEATFMPFSWFAFSSMTGVLEYYNLIGLKSSAESFQNVFSINMVEVNYKSFFHVDFGSTSLWPKRFELGYVFPVFDNFLYQNVIGDFDNMAVFLNLKGQYPGIGKIWFSFFLDEASLKSPSLELSRDMHAYQFGAQAIIPWLPFCSAKLSYTKIEPYNYTHTRNFVPWYGDIRMETNYVNNGVSLGHYLPPNSDEILFRLEAIPVISTRLHLQYQLIRHGADYGSRAVGGSSLWSELDPFNRDTNPTLRKYFLRDGAYQWMHIAKFGGEYALSNFNIPVKFFGEAGVVFSYFSDIEGPVNSGSPSSYSAIDTPEYPRSTAFVITIGVRLFQK